MTALPILEAVTLVAGIGSTTFAYFRERRRCSTLVRDLEEALRKNNRDEVALLQRKHLDTIKDEFISTVSHELRTPLTSIRGALGLLSAGVMGQVDDKAMNLLRIASSNTDRLVRLINDILDLERMESGRAPLHLLRCSLLDLIHHAAETMQSMAAAAGVTIDVVGATAAAPITFEGDPDRIQQVLCNLLSNAIKFSPRGGRVRIEAAREGDSILLRVIDRGRGIPSDKLESIFDRFGQVDPSDSRQKGGTGLGLAICRTIVGQHSGAIWAERNDENGVGGPGSTFVLRLPPLSAAQALAPLPPASEGSILVVDDDAGVRQVVAEQLRRHGYKVMESDSGEDALNRAATEKVEAILLDLFMPGMTGWETLERLKRNPVTAAVPVVVLSVLSPSVGGGGEASAALGSAQGWIQKPHNEGGLLHELSRVLHAGAGPGRILLVEDDAELASVVLASFAETEQDRKGVGIQHVMTVAEARAQCEKAPPDILVLDLTLPDGTGFALVDWLRQQPSLRTLPLVVYSGREVSRLEMDKLRLGPTQFLTKARVKPAEVEELVLAMVHHLKNPALEAQPA